MGDQREAAKRRHQLELYPCYSAQSAVQSLNGFEFRRAGVYPAVAGVVAVNLDLIERIKWQERPFPWYNSLMLRRVLLVFSPQPEGGFTVTSPILPELITEGDTLEEAYANVSDALAAVIELYADQGRALPAGVDLPVAGQIVWTDALVEVA
jgi:antitoxin HicB